jgi:predicted GIY-YIG superfamily endonuclease
MSTTIYVLRLAGGNWYVGKTDNFQKRMEEHVRGGGSAWTSMHKVLKVDKVVENASPFDEDRYVKEYMSKYGIDKVRGGSYVEIELDESKIDTLTKEIWAAKDLCTRCGRAGHFVKDCYAKTTVDGNGLEYEDDDGESDYEWECEYCEKLFSTMFECTNHEKSCKASSFKSSKTYTFKSSKTYTFKSSNSRDTCFRCGRPGHYSPDCYASKHVNGYYL